MDAEMTPRNETRKQSRKLAPGGGHLRAHPSDKEEAIYLREDPLATLAPIDHAGNILQGLANEDVSTILSRAAIRRFKQNEAIFCQGRPYDGIFIIQTGRVRTYYVSPAGREYTLAYWTIGHFVGVPEVYGTGNNLWAAEAATPSTTLAILSSADIVWLVGHVPAFAVSLVEGLVYKGRCLSTAVQMLGTRSMTSRLAHLLLALSRRRETHLNIPEPFTHSDLAKMIGSTRQWVTATIRRFQDERLITYSNQCIKIIDANGLQRLLR